MKSLLGITNFLRTVRSGSFVGAARELGISPVAVSKNVATLEKELGVRLLNRSTRALSLTDEGRSLYEQCDRPIKTIEEAFDVAKQASQSIVGLLRVTCLSPIGRALIIPLIQKFCAIHSHVSVDLRLDDHVVDMVADNFDIGIRVGGIKDPTIIARRISDLPFVVCGSPNYFSRCGDPKTIDDLVSHNCLMLGRPVVAAASIAKAATVGVNWRLGLNREAVVPPVSGSFISGDFNALEQAALGGMGLFHAPLPLVLPHFRSGTLRPVLPDAMSNDLSLFIHYRSRRNQPARTRVFVDFLLEHLRKDPDLATDFQVLCAPYWVKT